MTQNVSDLPLAGESLAANDSRQVAQALFDSIKPGEWTALTTKQPVERSEPFTDIEFSSFLKTAVTRFGANGRLTEEHAKNALCNPKLTPQETGALLALWFYTDEKTGRPIKAEQMDEIRLALAKQTEGLPLTDRENEFSSLVWRMRGYTRDATRFDMKLYKDESKPLASIVPEAALQASGVGNCHFVAALGSLAATNPSAIQNMIKDNRNGTYTVTFPGEKPTTVNAPTPGELILYDLDTRYGIWNAVMQKAYGKHERPQSIRNVDAGGGGSARADGLKTITEGKVDTDELFYTRNSVTHRKLSEAMSKRQPVVATMNNEILGLFGLSDNLENETGLQCGHAYSIVDFTANKNNPDSAMITLRNPNGENDWINIRPPKGIVDLRNGTFRMSLNDFTRIFSRVSYAQ